MNWRWSALPAAKNWPVSESGITTGGIESLPAEWVPFAPAPSFALPFQLPAP